MESIKAWPKAERPRERLLNQGAQALSDAELLAVLLRTGIKGRDVLSLSRDLLEQFQGLRGIGAAAGVQLEQVKGLGTAKISVLLAVGEISRRQLRENIFKKDVIRDPESVVVYLKRALQDQKIEVFKVIFLNKGNAVITEETVSSGTVDEAHVHPREIVKKALEYHATGVILVHNHPSGRCEPSQEDLYITRKIKTACEFVSVKVLDHLIIGGDQYFSFRERGMLE